MGAEDLFCAHCGRQVAPQAALVSEAPPRASEGTSAPNPLQSSDPWIASEAHERLERPARWLVIGGALLLLLSSSLPWFAVRRGGSRWGNPFDEPDGYNVSYVLGVEGWAGIVAMVLAVIALIVAVAVASRVLAQRPDHDILYVLVGVMSVLVVLIYAVRSGAYLPFGTLPRLGRYAGIRVVHVGVPLAVLGSLTLVAGGALMARSRGTTYPLDRRRT